MVTIYTLGNLLGELKWVKESKITWQDYVAMSQWRSNEGSKWKAVI